MSEQSATELTNVILRPIQADLADVKSGLEQANQRIGSLAETMMSMRRDMNGLRSDVRMLVVAFDGHTERLDHVDGRVERIENRLALSDA